LFRSLPVSGLQGDQLFFEHQRHQFLFTGFNSQQRTSDPTPTQHCDAVCALQHLPHFMGDHDDGITIFPQVV
jgi:hypothetical protein